MDIKFIGIACDHAGYTLKEHLKNYLGAKGYEIKDFGAYSDESMDYPDTAHPLAVAVESGDVDLGIAMCGTGNGISMSLNKHQGIRAALCWSPSLAALAKEHNNANVLSMPARLISTDEAEAIVDTFLSATFEGGRHQRRIDKIPIK